MSSDLFESDPVYQPLADRLRPQTLDEVVGKAHLIGPGKPLRVAYESGKLHSFILDLLVIFETGDRYHLIHALALLAVAWVFERSPGVLTNVAGWGFVVGIFVFSGSLYLMALSGARWLGAVTPIGGVSFLLGWAALFLVAIRGR